MNITEAKVQEIHTATDLSGCTYEQLRDADLWIKQYALSVLERRLSAVESKPVRDYVVLMARCHFGSVETDDLLQALGCCPEWMNKG